MSTALVKMRREPKEFEAAYALKKAALGPHVIPHWGWDEAEQRAIMEAKWRTKSFYRIASGEETLGTIALDEADGVLRISEFYIAPEHQGRGVGGEVLAPILRDADAKGVTARLECLKWNPAVALYQRHGFRIVREDDVHYFMERAPAR